MHVLVLSVIEPYQATDISAALHSLVDLSFCAFEALDVNRDEGLTMKMEAKL